VGCGSRDAGCIVVGGPACVNTEAVTDPALPRPMSEDYQAPSGAGLSPAAQAVYDAWYEAIDAYSEQDPPPQLAAALRAAADRARRGPEHWEGSYPDDYDKGWNEAVDYFTAIAAELEGAQ
jgi:hypothetical protein